MSRQKMLDQNQQILDNTNTIKRIHRIAEQTSGTTTDILRNLDTQRGQIGRQIDMNKQINQELGKVNRVTNQMTRRALCIKCALYLAIIALFALLVVAIIMRLNKTSDSNDNK